MYHIPFLLLLSVRKHFFNFKSLCITVNVLCPASVKTYFNFKTIIIRIFFIAPVGLLKHFLISKVNVLCP